MKFKVFDNKTGKEADTWNIALNEEWAQSLIYCDMEGFAITEDGNLVLMDECGHVVYCDTERFKVVFEDESPHGEWIPCSERLPDKDGVYLVTDEEGYVYEYDYSDFSTHNEKWTYCGKEIIAWRLLPDPYKKEGESE